MILPSVCIELDPIRAVRPVRAGDANQEYVNALNDPVRTRFMCLPEKTFTRNDVVAYIEGNERDGNAVLFGLFDNGALCGTSRLHDIAADKSTAHMGVMVFNPDIPGKGWGTRFIEAVSHYALHDMGIGKVRAGIYNDNIASRKAFQRAGFTITQESTDPAYQIWVKESLSRDE